MKIKRIVIENYRSIKNIDIQVSGFVNVFVGENSTGKSNIFSALEWLLGPTYPSFNYFGNECYFRGDSSLPVRVALTFDDGYTLEMAKSWNQPGNPQKRKGLNLDRRTINDEERQKYVSAFLGADRKLYDSPAMNRWSLMGRLLLDINRRFHDETMPGGVSKPEYFKEAVRQLHQETLFSVEDDNGENIMTKFTEILREETARQLNRNPNDLNLDIDMYDPWNFYRTLQIIITESDTGMRFLASDLGMGVQASVMIAILKAYSRLKLNNQTPIIIDEPELYLHPQGRRNFYRIIRELADSGTQVFLITHSPEFIDLSHFEEISVVRKDSERGTYIRQAVPKNFVADLYARHPKLGTVSEESVKEHYVNAFEGNGDSQKASEALFARKVILVEGESEALILPYFFELLKFDAISEGVTIVRCGGKSETDRFYRLYSEFGIPCYIIFDGDMQNIDKREDSIKQNKAILSLFDVNLDFPDGKVHSQYLGFEYRLEENLGIGHVGNDIKSLGLYRKVKKVIQKAQDVPGWVSEVIDRIRELPSEADSVLRH